MNVIRKRVREVAPAPIFGKQMLEESLEATLDRPRSDARLLLGFAFAAVALYGLVAQIVNACATTLECEWLSGHHAGKSCHRRWRTPAPDWNGILAGAVLALALRPVSRALIFGGSTIHVTDLGLAAVTLAAVSVAALVPPRRAAGVDPTHCMRSE